MTGGGARLRASMQATSRQAKNGSVIDSFVARNEASSSTYVGRDRIIWIWSNGPQFPCLFASVDRLANHTTNSQTRKSISVSWQNWMVFVEALTRKIEGAMTQHVEIGY